MFLVYFKKHTPSKSDSVMTIPHPAPMNAKNIFYHSLQQEHFLTLSPRCKTSELLVDHFGKEISSIPTDRTQTQEEALEFSVWSQFSTFNMSLLRFSLRTPLLCLHFALPSKDELDEAFCRDVESFSPAFTPRVRIQG